MHSDNVLYNRITLKNLINRYFRSMKLKHVKIFAASLQTVLILISVCFFPCQVTAQRLAGQQKISPLLLQEIRLGKIKGPANFRVTVSGDLIPAALNKSILKQEKVYTAGRFSVFNISATTGDVLEKLLQSDQIVFIENGSRKPKEELQVGNLDLSVNKINLVHRKYPVWNGEGLVVSVKENKPDTTDIDFTGRFLSTTLSSQITSSHASIMSTMIAGGGNTWHLGKGAAWGSTISSSDFASLLPDPDAAYRQYKIFTQNHSYGVGVESYYGADASLYDQSMLNNKKLLHVFSAGNSGLSAATTGTYSGLKGFANLTGSFKMAKNIITVGATDSFSVVETLSSKGPAHDGRIKPELVAFGEDGSSGSAALVSGTALLLQQAYLELNDSLPVNALIKSVIVNSADDVGKKEVDYANGFGSLNAKNAMHTIFANRFFSGNIANGNTQEFSISIPAGIKKIKVTLAWNDLPAVPNAARAIVQDIDLELLHPLSGSIWNPWVLNSFPHPDSLQKPAERKRDSLNNIEQVTLDDPQEGLYRIRIFGFNVIGSQEYFVSYQLDSANIFEWEYPTANDFITADVSNTIRWHSTSSFAKGKLEYSVDGGSAWQSIQENMSLATGFARWNAPAVTSQALLRMTIGSVSFISDTFTISSRTSAGVGFNCPDSFLLFWDKLPAVKDYRVYTLGTRYLDTIEVTSDSLMVFPKNLNPGFYYAVAPLIGNQEGMRSYSFDYSQQGVTCYIRSFLGSLVNNTAKLELFLGTLYGIKKIVFEKLSDGRFISLETVDKPNSLLQIFSDNRLKKGLNVYRVRLELADGKIIYSEPETVYYFSENRFIVYPNPVSQNQPVEILTNESILSTVILQVFDAYGRKIIQKKMNNFLEKISTSQLARGMYFFRFIVEGEKDTILKVIVL